MKDGPLPWKVKEGVLLERMVLPKIWEASSNPVWGCLLFCLSSLRRASRRQPILEEMEGLKLATILER